MTRVEERTRASCQERAGGARGARAYLAAEHLHGLLLGGFGVHLESEGACVGEGGRGSEAVLGMEMMVEEASRGGRGGQGSDAET